MIGELCELRQIKTMTAPLPPDAEEVRWVERARAGEEAAYGWLLTRYRQRAVRLAAHILRRPEEAEDAAQEAFIRAFRNLHRFRRQGRFYTWLYQIVVRVCLERKRSARWRSERPASELLAPSAHRSVAEAGSTDRRLLVEELLDRLSPEMRATLALRELEGLEYAEIAETLEIPIGTVRSRLNAAREQFRALWTAAQQEADRV